MGEDVPIAAKPPVPKKQPSFQHDAPFRPCAKPPRSGHLCSISKFPEHVPCPPREKVRKRKLEDEPDAPPAFKGTHKYKSRPSSSVATNLRNLKASYSSLFRRR